MKLKQKVFAVFVIAISPFAFFAIREDFSCRFHINQAALCDNVICLQKHIAWLNDKHAIEGISFYGEENIKVPFYSAINNPDSVRSASVTVWICFGPNVTRILEPIDRSVVYSLARVPHNAGEILTQENKTPSNHPNP